MSINFVSFPPNGVQRNPLTPLFPYDQTWLTNVYNRTPNNVLRRLVWVTPDLLDAIVWSCLQINWTFTRTGALFFPKLFRGTRSQACMDPSSSDDDECFSVQLDSSDMAPNAEKVFFSYSARHWYPSHSMPIRQFSGRGFQWGDIIWNLMGGYRMWRKQWSKSCALYVFIR